MGWGGVGRDGVGRDGVGRDGVGLGAGKVTGPVTDIEGVGGVDDTERRGVEYVDGSAGVNDVDGVAGVDDTGSWL